MNDKKQEENFKHEHLGFQADGSFAYADGIQTDSAFVPRSATEEELNSITKKIKKGKFITGDFGRNLTQNIQ